jgi:hypothetical protein
LNEEALERIKWRNRFGRGCGPVVWQITDDTYIYIYTHICILRGFSFQIIVCFTANTLSTSEMKQCRFSFFANCITCASEINVITSCYSSGRNEEINEKTQVRILFSHNTHASERSF